MVLLVWLLRVSVCCLYGTETHLPELEAPSAPLMYDLRHGDAAELMRRSGAGSIGSRGFTH